MATQTIKLVEGNTAPSIQITCERGTTVIDLSGCTVDLIISFGGVQTNIGHSTCSINSPSSAGIVTYSPQPTDFSLSGTYVCDVQITYGGGTIETLYDQLKIKARLKVLSTS